MRALFLTAALLLAMPAPIQAAPTCQDRAGITTRCGTPGAMPVGWQPSPQELWESELSRPPGPDSESLWTAFGLVGLLFALIALMPRFDGARDDDWDPGKNQKSR
jgi:hypothetical protein